MESSFKKDMYDLLVARRTVDVSVATDRLKELWVWFGLVCLAKCSHRTWEWHHKYVRKSVPLNKCVTASDEAFAMQILNVREESFKSAAGQSGAVKNNGRRRSGPDFLQSANLFCWYHHQVKLVRESGGDSIDERGWYGYLKSVQQQVDVDGKATKGKGILEGLDLPVDE